MIRIAPSVYFLIAFFFAVLITFIDVILNINFLDIGDRVNYLERAKNIEFYDDGFSLITFLISLRDEPLFSFIFYFLDSIGLPDIATVRVIIFASTLTTFL